MRRFIIVLFIISLCTAGGTWYWRTYFPEGGGQNSVVAQSESLSTDDRQNSRSVRRAIPPHKLYDTSRRTYSFSDRRTSGRQDMAMTISILSSVISALAAVAQAWFARGPRQ